MLNDQARAKTGAERETVYPPASLPHEYNCQQNCQQTALKKLT